MAWCGVQEARLQAEEERRWRLANETAEEKLQREAKEEVAAPAACIPARQALRERACGLTRRGVRGLAAG